MPVPAGGDDDVLGPEWAPTLVQVAGYVPHRTLERSDTSNTESEDVYSWTFTAGTRPNAEQVLQLIADGAAWVTSRVAPLHTSSWDTGRVIVALYAAAAVERGWPDNDQSLQRANDLEKRMDALLAGLVVSNAAAVAGDGDPETVDMVYPVFSFPAADPRYDSARYW